ncbi:MAG: PA2779 family protein [Nitrospirota bacterium]
MLFSKRTMLKTSLVWYLIVAFFIITSLPSDSLAMFLPSNFYLNNKDSSFNRSEDIKKIQSFLEKKIVSQRLADLGLTKEEISSRLSRLSDRQIHNTAADINTLYPGTGGDALGVVVTLLIITILVVILLQITGHKVIITK